MGLCSSKKSKNHHRLPTDSNKYALQQHSSNENTQKVLQSEMSPSSNQMNQKRQGLIILSSSPTSKPIQQTAFIDEIAENMNQRCTLKTFISIKNMTFSKYYYMVTREQAQGKIKLNEQMILVQHNLSGKIRVAEFINKVENGQKLVEAIIQNQLLHPNMIRIFEIFQDNTNYQIIHDFCNSGTLLQYLNSVVYSQQQAAFTIKQIIDLVQYFHQRGLCHNFLTLSSFQKSDQLNSNYIKLTDFKPLYIKSFGKDKDIIYYLSPEAIKSPEIYSPERDIWSIGILLYKMLSGKYPFTGNTIDEISKSMINFFQTENLDYDCLPPKSVNFIRSFLQVNPKQRIKLSEALDNRWLQNYTKNYKIEINTFSKSLDSKHTFSQLQCCFLQQMISTYNSDQEQRLFQIFSQFDVNHDGKLNRIDLAQTYLQHCSNLQEVKEQLDAMYNGLDFNHRGEINFQEFLIGVIDKNQLITTQNLQEIFKTLANVQGRITLQKMVTLYPSRKEELQFDFSVYNNQINYNEFEELMLEIL